MTTTAHLTPHQHLVQAMVRLDDALANLVDLGRYRPAAIHELQECRTHLEAARSMLYGRSSVEPADTTAGGPTK